ncbi:MAG TPA: dCTP deaminase [Gaiellaceae bacterium]
MTDTQIREAVEAGQVVVDPLSDDSLQPASYDLRLGERAVITKSLEIEKLRDDLESKDTPEIDITKAGAISIPAGAFALVVTRERIRLSPRHAGHIGLRSYFARKGLLLLAGLQVDPGFSGHLVLGLANVSPRSVYLHYEEPIATLEIHELSAAASRAYSGIYAGQQERPRIPRADADYLRTIETLSVSDLTRALLRLSDNVSTLSRDVRVLWIPLGLAVIAAILLRVL